jgi:L-rhamnose mutarotase
MGGEMEKIAFRLKVKQGLMSEYVERHRHVWPEMLRALADTGWRNYSLFLDEADGTLIGYFETEDLAASLNGMAETEVNARWQAEMAEYFEDLGGANPDSSFQTLRQVFNLDQQLSETDLDA